MAIICIEISKSITTKAQSIFWRKRDQLRKSPFFVPESYIRIVGVGGKISNVYEKIWRLC
jgi:hypothetical protein